MSNFNHQKTHRDQIWPFINKMKSISSTINKLIAEKDFTPMVPDYHSSNQQEFTYKQYGMPVRWKKGNTIISLRFEDSLFLLDPDAWTRPKPSVIISDNVLLKPIQGTEINTFPEHAHVYYTNFAYEKREPTWDYNCFMNRISGDRSIVFYELIRRKLLDKGLVSFNCYVPGNNEYKNDKTDYTKENYKWQYESADLVRYSAEHEQGYNIIPYNNIEPAGLGLEQCIIDSRVSLILETYISDDHIVFSEKIFRTMQLPRPWILYSSPGAVNLLKSYGFDVLDDYVDHSYDSIEMHWDRLDAILEQLETFINCQYTEQDYIRFETAARNNQKLLLQFEKEWPAKFNTILEEINQL